VAVRLRRAGTAADQTKDAAQRWFAANGVKRDLWRACPTTFSGGEQQKVNLARTLILRQRLLLLDEPTASRDAGVRAVLIRRLAHLKASGGGDDRGVSPSRRCGGADRPRN